MTIVSPVSSLGYFTDDLGGIGGVIKQRAEDFLVEEQPLYEPIGEGEHLYVFVEKRSVTTSDVVRRLAKAFRVRRSDIGYAGLKDKHAVTQQVFSVHRPDPSEDQRLLERIQHTGFNLLWARRHRNKLRRGHLAGNRFVIHIRGVQPTAVIQAKRVLDRLIESGVPNFIGQQRFGYRQNNHLLGRLLLQRQWPELLDQMLGRPDEAEAATTRAGRQAYEQGDYAAALASWPRHLRHDRQALDALRQGKSDEQAVMHIDVQQLEFLVSSVQSHIFNHVLDHRLRNPEGLGFDRLVEGDLAWVHASRAVFAVDAVTADRENGPDGRVRTGEVSPSGPMWGAQMPKPTGEPGRWEQKILADHGLTDGDFDDGPGGSSLGRRRPLRVFMKNPDVCGGVDEHGPYVRLAFDLPRGAFATTVLREIMKVDAWEAYRGGA